MKPAGMSRALALAAWTLAASGCAAPAPTGAGWHLAVITRLGETLPPRGPGVADCRLASPPPDAQAHGYAEVAYRAGLRSRHRIARLPESGDYEVGEAVYVDVEDCAVALRPTAR